MTIVGISDKNQVFYLFSLAVCKNVCSSDFRFVFGALHIYGFSESYCFFACGCESIIQGLKNTFGEPKVRIICFFYVFKNLEKYLETCEDDKRF